MAVQKILIAQFIELAQKYPVLDVRSPGEYLHAHIPGAFSLPLFNDDERKVVGTAYKQESRKTAIKTGLDYFGIKMRKMVEETESLVHSLREKDIDKREPQSCVLVHCWRGGMRSEGVAWLLDLYGFKVFTLAGGYKSYRKWARAQFEKKYNFTVLGGFTGSGKTLVLHELKRLGEAVIDLEGLASHKGSAFGGFGQKPQPSQEMFENLLATELSAVSRKISAPLEQVSPLNTINNIYIEDESRRIGLLHLPNSLWEMLQNSEYIFVDVPFEKRLSHLTQEYGKYEEQNIVNAIARIQKRLGGQETKMAVRYLLENNYKECFRILLTYYDKCYGKTMINRENIPSLFNKITCTGVDVKNITNTLINERAGA